MQKDFASAAVKRRSFLRQQEIVYAFLYCEQSLKTYPKNSAICRPIGFNRNGFPARFL